MFDDQLAIFIFNRREKIDNDVDSKQDVYCRLDNPEDVGFFFDERNLVWHKNGSVNQQKDNDHSPDRLNCARWVDKTVTLLLARVQIGYVTFGAKQVLGCAVLEFLLVHVVGDTDQTGSN